MKVDVDYDPEIHFQTLRNYAWLSDKAPESGNPVIDSDSLLHDRIHKETEAWMAVHGYHKTAKNKADFLLTYRLVMENKTRVTVLDNYYAYPLCWRYGYGAYPFAYNSWYYFPEIQTYQYQRGTFILDMINPKTRKLMWRGMVYRNLSQNVSQQKLKDYVSKAILELLDRFYQVAASN
jgi:hypothetical protein